MAISYTDGWEGSLLALAQEALHPTAPRTPVPVSDASILNRAYEQCEAVIAEHGKTFNMASRLLAAPKRRAITALYAFSRVEAARKRRRERYNGVKGAPCNAGMSRPRSATTAT